MGEGQNILLLSNAAPTPSTDEKKHNDNDSGVNREFHTNKNNMAKLKEIWRKWVLGTIFL